MTRVKGEEIRGIVWSDEMVGSMGLRKEYIVTEITASPDGAPYVFVTFKSPEEIRNPQGAPFASPRVTFGSMDDMVKNLGNVISRQMTRGFVTVVKLSLNAYETLDIKVGDRIAMDLNKIGPS